MTHHSYLCISVWLQRQPVRPLKIRSPLDTHLLHRILDSGMLKPVQMFRHKALKPRQQLLWINDIHTISAKGMVAFHDC